MKYLFLLLPIAFLLPVAAVPAQNDPCPPSKAKGLHTVQQGETLYAISKKYNATVAQICTWNGIKATDVLPECAELYVAAPKKGAPALARGLAPTTYSGAAAMPANYRHIVKKGENLSDIATKYGYTLERLLKINNITYGSPVYVGQELRVDDCNCNNGDTNMSQDKEIQLAPRPQESSTQKSDDQGEKQINPKGELDRYTFGRKTKQAPQQSTKAWEETTAATTNTGTVYAETPAMSSQSDDEQVQETLRRYGNPASGYAMVIHWVSAGDTPSNVADLYGMSEAEVMEINRLSSRSQLRPGQRLVVENRRPGANAETLPIYNSTAADSREQSTIQRSDNEWTDRREQSTIQRSDNEWTDRRDQSTVQRSDNEWTDRREETNPQARNNNAANTSAPKRGDENINSSAEMNNEEMDMVREINLLRGNPPGYIPYIEAYIKELKDFNDKDAIATAKELINELKKTPKLSKLEPSACIYAAAKKHGEDLRSRGKTDHQGADGSWPWDRITRDCRQMTDGNENLVGGPASVRKAVVLLAVDHGIDTRGHRKTLLNPDWRYVACRKVGTVGNMPNYWIQNFGL